MGMSGERMGRYINLPPVSDAQRAAANERGRLHRWRAPSAARVTHKTRGTVVVPHCSKFAAIMCAAEAWGCHWLEIMDAEVWAAKPGDKVATMPYLI